MRPIAVVAALVAVLALGGGATADPPTLVGTVGPFFTIDLQDASGKHVDHLDPGTYQILVHDLSAGHDFHLIGPGISEATGVLFQGDETWTLDLKDGAYTYQCDVHPGEMSGGFTVGAAQAPPPVTTTTAKPKQHPKKKPKKKR